MAIIKAVFGFCILALWCRDSLAQSESQILTWSLQTGNYNGDQNPIKAREKTLDLAKIPKKIVELRDHQYRQKRLYRAATISEVLKLGNPGPQDDAALLVFDNGMRIPVYFSGLNSQMLSEIYLVDAICQTSKKNAAKKEKFPEMNCKQDFPAIDKVDDFATKTDPRPIRFRGNKIVSTTGKHPDMDSSQVQSFSPWDHADALKEIIYISSASYWQQFKIGEDDGFKVFQQRCQFCHSINYVGSRFGWDFVKPFVLAEKRKPDQLLNHIKVPKARRTEQGLMMPVQKDIKEKDVAALWRWMQLVGKKPLQPYHP